jgi:hypothetical protein
MNTTMKLLKDFLLIEPIKRTGGLFSSGDDLTYARAQSGHILDVAEGVDDADLVTGARCWYQAHDAIDIDAGRVAVSAGSIIAVCIRDIRDIMGEQNQQEEGES